MTRKLYEHERHPLDIAAEEEAKNYHPPKKAPKVTPPEERINELFEKQLSKPLSEWPYSQLEYACSKYLDRQYMFTSNKLRREVGWPTTMYEMVMFLTEKNFNPEDQI